jgi:3-hydroxymyristoyl/3-hydroxydecanoyl-(acyl carrier protein) dehydratase
MTAHTVNEETVIQKFEFSLSTDGKPFYAGNSVFGFFPGETMARQVGLDGGKASQPLYLQPGGAAMQLRRFNLPQAVAAQTGLRLAGGFLALLDEVLYDPTGGAAGLGYIYASRQISPEDWYFRNHFFQDPVMPGSLGVEAVLEALRAFAMVMPSTGRDTPGVRRSGETLGLGAETTQAKFELSDSQPFFWKYRGQVMPDAGKMQLEIQVRRREETARGTEIEGDASLWAGSIRIYSLKNLAIRIVKG